MVVFVMYWMGNIVGVCFLVVCKDGKVFIFGDVELCFLFGLLEILIGEDFDFGWWSGFCYFVG